MNPWLNKIRTPKAAANPASLIRGSLLTLLLGIALGVFSKWLDKTAIDDTIWWQHLLGVLDLRNVFSGFALWLVLALAIGIYSGSPRRAEEFWPSFCGGFWYFEFGRNGYESSEKNRRAAIEIHKKP